MASAEDEAPADVPAGDDPADDGPLVAGALRGDRSSLEELTRRLMVVPRMMREINRRLGGPLSGHDVEDLSQDALIQIWKKLQRFGSEGTLDAWLYRFCQLEFMNRRRKLFRRRDRSRFLGDDADVESLHGHSAPSTSSATSDLGPDRVEAAVGSLSESERRVLALRHEEGLSFPSIAKELGETEVALKARYYRALQALRRRLMGNPDAREGEERNP